MKAITEDDIKLAMSRMIDSLNVIADTSDDIPESLDRFFESRGLTGEGKAAFYEATETLAKGISGDDFRDTLTTLRMGVVLGLSMEQERDS